MHDYHHHIENTKTPLEIPPPPLPTPDSCNTTSPSVTLKSPPIIERRRFIPNTTTTNSNGVCVVVGGIDDDGGNFSSLNDTTVRSCFEINNDEEGRRRRRRIRSIRRNNNGYNNKNKDVYTQEEHYDHEEYQQEQGISTTTTTSGIAGTCFNLLNCILGAGIIGVPYAISQTGIVVGILLFALVTYLTSKSLCILVESAKFVEYNIHVRLMRRKERMNSCRRRRRRRKDNDNANNDTDIDIDIDNNNDNVTDDNEVNDNNSNINNVASKPIKIETYEELMSYPYGSKGKKCMHFVIFFGSFGSLIAYLIIIKDIVPQIFGIKCDYQDDDEGNGCVEREILLILTSFIILLPISLQKDLASLSFISFISVLSDFVLVGLVIASCPISESISYYSSGLWSLLYHHAINPHGIFIGLGIISFAMACQGATFVIYESLDQPRTTKRWGLVVNLGVGASASLTLILGMTGFIAFLDETRGDVLLNFKNDSVLIQGARILLCITIFLTYPMSSFIARHVMLYLLTGSTNGIVGVAEEEVSGEGNERGGCRRSGGGKMSYSVVGLGHDELDVVAPAKDSDNDNDNRNNCVRHNENTNVISNSIANELHGYWTTKLLEAISRITNLDLNQRVTIIIYICALIPALIVDDLGPVLSIIGAVAGGFRNYVAPGMIYLGIHGESFLSYANGLLLQSSSSSASASTSASAPLAASSYSYSSWFSSFSFLSFLRRGFSRLGVASAGVHNGVYAHFGAATNENDEYNNNNDKNDDIMKKENKEKMEKEKNEVELSPSSFPMKYHHRRHGCNKEEEEEEIKKEEANVLGGGEREVRDSAVFLDLPLEGTQNFPNDDDNEHDVVALTPLDDDFRKPIWWYLFCFPMFCKIAKMGIEGMEQRTLLLLSSSCFTERGEGDDDDDDDDNDGICNDEKTNNVEKDGYNNGQKDEAKEEDEDNDNGEKDDGDHDTNTGPNECNNDAEKKEEEDSFSSSSHIMIMQTTPTLPSPPVPDPVSPTHYDFIVAMFFIFFGILAGAIGLGMNIYEQVINRRTQ